MARIAAMQKCPQDVIMLLNGIVEPSSLRIGQKLVVVPMRLRVEIYPLQREVSVWDGEQLVAELCCMYKMWEKILAQCYNCLIG